MQPWRPVQKVQHFTLPTQSLERSRVTLQPNEVDLG
jgi:hypothetical protein